uniref:Uncharacterized protein n=1 Tax=Lactuca sativa TaxID=4236 RepID=A0A9R1WG93_LACSA|nr:hypothetical protein LSAT_V11C100043540 [Lactuca sativa]
MVGGKSPIDALKCQLVCKLFRDSATSKAIYQTMDTNRLRFQPFSVDMDEVIRRCRKLNNPHILFNDGMEKDEVGKQLLQDTADKGQLDVIFVLEMLLMDEGCERKHEALIMLNNSYINTSRSWNLRQTCYQVRSHLHPFVSRYGKAFMHEYSWLFNCEICLWDACLVEFPKMFDISLE